MSRRKFTVLVVASALTLIGTIAGTRAIQNKQFDHGWHITVYYTAVESFHHQALESVYGCPTQQCEKGDTPLGQYPGDFISVVKQEGTGRITSGRYTGAYLNWSYDVGFWIDSVAADTHGNKLTPYVSAAADASVLKQSTQFAITSCGTTNISAAVCNKFKSSHFIIRDEFTPGLGGKKHLDIYIGEEDQPNFEDSQTYTDLTNATIRVTGK